MGYKVRLRMKDGKILNKVIKVKGVLTPRLIHQNRVYIFEKRDVDRVPYYYEIVKLWMLK